MKLTKIISILTAIIMAVSMAGVLLVNAGESDEKLYTLEEFLEMSDEEFLEYWSTIVSWNSFEEYMEYMKDRQVKFGGYLTGGYSWLIDKDTSIYKANVTEKRLEELMGDAIEYTYRSPTDLNGDLIYNYIFSISVNSLYGAEITNENLILYTKIRMCANQIIDGERSGTGALATGGDSKDVVKGDVNLDETFDLYDAIWIAKHLVHSFTLSEGQQKIGDINEDGVCDLYDVIEIAKLLMTE